MAYRTENMGLVLQRFASLSDHARAATDMLRVASRCLVHDVLGPPSPDVMFQLEQEVLWSQFADLLGLALGRTGGSQALKSVGLEPPASVPETLTDQRFLSVSHLGLRQPPHLATGGSILEWIESARARRQIIQPLLHEQWHAEDALARRASFATAFGAQQWRAEMRSYVDDLATHATEFPYHDHQPMNEEERRTVTEATLGFARTAMLRHSQGERAIAKAIASKLRIRPTPDELDQMELGVYNALNGPADEPMAVMAYRWSSNLRTPEYPEIEEAFATMSLTIGSDHDSSFTP